MLQTSQILTIVAILLSLARPSLLSSENGPPFPKALDAAAISIPSLSSILEYGLIIGNGDINAIIYHDAKTCPNNSNNRYGLPMRLAKDVGIPYVVFNGDLNDLRLYSEEQARTQFEALVEQLHSKA